MILRDEIERVRGPRRDRPDAIIRSSVDDVAATVHPQFTFALEEVVENAITHTASPDPPDVFVSTTVSDSRVSLVIADNGPGIPDAEIDALDAGEETSLRRSSGIGRWIVKPIVSRLAGQLEIYSGPDGTQIEIHLTRSDDPGSSFLPPRGRAGEGASARSRHHVESHRSSRRRTALVSALAA